MTTKTKTKAESLEDTIRTDAKKLGGDVVELGKSTYFFGLGAMATAEEEMRNMFDRMISKGEKVDKKIDKEANTMIGKATGKAKELGQTVEDRVEDTMAVALNRAGVPTSREIQTLIARVEELTLKVDALSAR